MFKCTCGKEMHEPFNFCTKCGKKLREVCNCWVKKEPYNCGYYECPGGKLFALEARTKKELRKEESLMDPMKQSELEILMLLKEKGLSYRQALVVLNETQESLKDFSFISKTEKSTKSEQSSMNVLNEDTTLKEKEDDIVNKVLDCAIAAANKFMNGQQVNSKALFSLGESIRKLNHIKAVFNDFGPSLLMEKPLQLVELYFNCLNKAANDFLNGRPINSDAIYALHDSISTLHHLKSLGLIEHSPLSNKPNGQ